MATTASTTTPACFPLPPRGGSIAAASTAATVASWSVTFPLPPRGGSIAALRSVPMHAGSLQVFPLPPKGRLHCGRDKLGGAIREVSDFPLPPRGGSIAAQRCRWGRDCGTRAFRSHQGAAPLRHGWRRLLGDVAETFPLPPRGGSIAASSTLRASGTETRPFRSHQGAAPLRPGRVVRAVHHRRDLSAPKGRLHCGKSETGGSIGTAVTFPLPPRGGSIAASTSTPPPTTTSVTFPLPPRGGSIAATMTTKEN